MPVCRQINNSNTEHSGWLKAVTLQRSTHTHPAPKPDWETSTGQCSLCAQKEETNPELLP